MIGKAIYLTAFSGLVYWGMNYLGRDRSVLLEQTSAFVNSRQFVNVRFGVRAREGSALVISPDTLGIKADRGEKYEISYAILNSGQTESSVTAELVPAVHGENSDAIEITPQNIQLRIPANKNVVVSFTLVLASARQNPMDTIKLDLVVSGVDSHALSQKMRLGGSQN
jgi:hypothetical protein